MADGLINRGLIINNMVMDVLPLSGISKKSCGRNFIHVLTMKLLKVCSSGMAS